MKSVLFSKFAGPKKSLLANVYNGSGKCEVEVVDTNQNSKNLVSTIKLDSSDKIKSLEWFHVPAKKGSVTQNGKRSNNALSNGNGPDKNGKSVNVSSYLIIGLEAGEILVYSFATKEFINKISSETSASIICAENETGNIWAYDSENLALKKFKGFDNRLQESHVWRHDKSINFASTIKQDGATKLVLASSQLYIISPEEELSFVKVAPTKLHNHQIKEIYQSETNPDLIAIIRNDHAYISILSITTSTILTNLRTKANVSKLVPSFSTTGIESLLAVTDEGIEVFINPFDSTLKRSSRKLIECNFQIEAQGPILNANQKSNTSFVAVSYNGSKCDFTSFTLNLDTQESNISINDPESSSNGQEVLTNGNSNTMDVDVALEVASDDDQNSDDDESDEEGTEDFQVEEPQEVYELVQKYKDEPVKLVAILEQNQDKARKAVYILSDEDSISLFKILGLRILEKASPAFNEWIKSLLLIKGNLLIKDADSVGVLKFMKSSLSESTKLIPNLLSLQGRLTLLQSQITLRKQMLNAQGDSEDQEEVNGDGLLDQRLVGNDTSVFYDGENDEDYDDGLAISATGGEIDNGNDSDDAMSE